MEDSLKQQDETVDGQSVLKNRPKDSAFIQQRLKAYHPTPTPKSAIIMFLTLCVLFLLFGSIMISFSNGVQVYKERYDDSSDCQHTSWEDDAVKPCSISIEVDEDMTAPIYFYFELHNFFQNHRRYVKSRTYNQLKGEDLGEDEIKDFCDPIITMDDLERDAKQLPATLDVDKDDPANPCGLIAKTIFNDTFVLINEKGKVIDIDQEDIAWASDIDNKFERLDDWEEKQWLDVENEHFIVWMRTAAFPDFRKLWGKIDDDLDAGTYQVQIASLYDAEAYDGEKWVVLATVNSLGGDNSFLGVLLLIFSGLSLFFALLFIFKGYVCKRERRRVETHNENSILSDIT